jgi:hypothetical protein
MLALALTLAVAMASIEPPMADVLAAVRCVESSCGVDLRDGDLHRPICERSRGAFQVRPIAVRELVRVGRLDAADIPGFSLTNCVGIRKWLAVPSNNYKAARLYLLLIRERTGNIEDALAAYNCGNDYEQPRCRRYAGQVLAIASGE